MVTAQSLTVKLALTIIVTLALALLHLTMVTAVFLGTFLGFCMSLALEEEWLRFDARAVWWKQLIKLTLVLGVVFGLRLGLKALFPAEAIFNFARYTIIGLWIGMGAPWVFLRLRLTESGKGATPRTDPKPAIFDSLREGGRR